MAKETETNTQVGTDVKNDTLSSSTKMIDEINSNKKMKSNKTTNPLRQISIDKVVINIGVGEAGDKLIRAEKVIDLLTYQSVCKGVIALNEDTGKIKALLADNVICATGGYGRLYSCTTNPEVATGDGVAAAYRAGAELMDLEFIQFHPTVFYHPGFTTICSF